MNVIHPLGAELETYVDPADNLMKMRVVLTNQSKTAFNGSYQVDYESADHLEGNYSTNLKTLEPGKTEVMNIPELAVGTWRLRAYNSSGMLLQESEGPTRANITAALGLPRISMHLGICT